MSTARVPLHPFSANLTAEVFEWNDASVRVLRKVRFILERRFRKHREKDGNLVDVLCFVLLQADLDDSP